jgi:hypothetical protein
MYGSAKVRNHATKDSRAKRTLIVFSRLDREKTAFTHCIKLKNIL